MEVRDAILARRSVRAYTDEPVTEGEVEILLEAAMAAPSASNVRPWRFVVVTERDRLTALAGSHPYGNMLAEAGCAIVVCGDPRASERYWVQDCSAATENILLAATGLGLGAVWLGCHPRPERIAAVRGFLGIPGEIEVLALVSIGRPAEHPEPRTQLEPEKVHREIW